MRTNGGIAALVIAGSLLTGSGQADLIRNVGVGLAEAGFNAEGSHNVLSGGWDFLLNNNFSANDPFRFGVGDLRLQGPISLDVSTGTRFVPTLDLSFRTALDRDANAAPLNYTLRSDVGRQETEITGSVLVDGNLSLNAFGFYDLSLTYSSRQTVTNTGNVTDQGGQFDVDLGPTVVSGNIVADMLAAVTDPIFEQAGTENPFAAFSGRMQLARILEDAARDAELLLTTQNKLLSSSIIGPLPHTPSAIALSTHPQGSRLPGGSVVPEPAVLLLMLAGVPLVFARRMGIRLFQR